MQILSSLITLLAVAASAVVAAPLEARQDPFSGFTICSKPNSPIVVNSITLNPPTVTAGVPVNITLSGELRTTVFPGAKNKITAKLFGIQVYDETLDLCGPGLECPVAPGPRDITLSFGIPKEAPSVTVGVKAVASNADGSELLCIENKRLKVQAA
ncbi:Phosphatidylglycerol/phosphatidylinositol transfer protein [Chytridiales sp. JEL 0842]|nr:Phosphatidylglycerol/phosphatidylinositol transfer protein [Chytridiales sp. JEL 0842]